MTDAASSAPHTRRPARPIVAAAILTVALVVPTLRGPGANASGKEPEGKGPEVAVEHPVYLPGDDVDLEGEGFEQGDVVHVVVYGGGEASDTVQERSFDLVADEDGGVETTFTADPNGVTGLHAIRADDGGGGEGALSSYQVVRRFRPTVTTQARAFVRGDPVNVAGSEFRPERRVEIAVTDPHGGVRTLRRATDEDGTFEVSLRASVRGTLGTYTIVASGGRSSCRHGARRRGCAHRRRGRWAAPPVTYDVVRRPGKATTGFCGGDDWEPEIAADDYAHVYAVWTHFPGATSCDPGSGGAERTYIAVSSDGGATFGAPHVVSNAPGGLNYTDHADPVVAVNESGEVFVSFLAWGVQNNHTDVYVAKSTDFGRTFEASNVVKVNGTASPRPCIDCDHPWTVATGNDVYVMYADGGNHYLSLSTDDGQSYAETRVLASGSVAFPEGGIADGSGNAWFAWGDCRTGNCTQQTGAANDYRVSRTTAGTTTTSFVRPVTGDEGPACPINPCQFAFFGGQNDITMDGAGTLYMIYQTGQVDSVAQSPPVLELTRCPANADCMQPANWVDMGRVDDKDATAAPNDCGGTVAANTARCYALFPRIQAGVAPGHVNVVWMDDRNGGSQPPGHNAYDHTNGWNTWYRTSTDGGATWSGASQRLSSYDPLQVASFPNGFQFPYGDYQGIASVCGSDASAMVWAEGWDFTGGPAHPGHVISRTVGTLPASPGSLDVTGSGSTHVELDWSASASAGVSAYRIYRGQGLGDMQQIGSVSGSTLHFVDDPAPAAPRMYSVSAVDAGGEGCRRNPSPIVALTGPSRASVGQAHTYAFTVSDRGQSSFSLSSETCGGGALSAAGFDSSTGAGSFACTFTDSDPHTVSVRVADGSGGSGDGSVPVTVGIDFPAIPDHAVNDPDFDPGATSPSGLPVTYTASGSCSIVAGKVHIIGAGSCTVTAHQPGDPGHPPDQDVSRTFSIPVGDQTIAFNALSAKTYGNPDFNVSATATSGLGVTFTVGAADQCTISGTLVHLLAAGSCTVSAHQGGNANWNPAPDVDRTFAINKANQTIAFAPLPDRGYPGPDVPLSSTASSGLVVTFTVGASDQCVLATATSLHLTGVGSCTVTAHQAGNANYDPAPDVVRTFSIASSLSDQTITFNPLADKTFGTPDFNVSASASSGLAVTFTAAGPCGVTGTLVHLTGAGSCAITAHQAGNGSYNPAPDLARDFAVAKAPTQTTLQLSATTVVHGQKLTFTAHVASAAGAPPGKVAILADGVKIGGATLASGTAKKKLVVPGTAGAQVKVVAKYKPGAVGASYAPGKSAVTKVRLT
jgi:hypothetical protein